MHLEALLHDLEGNISRWKYPHSLRTFSYKENGFTQVLYYNVNFTCNSNCVFCAANLTNKSNNGNMLFQDILNSTNNYPTHEKKAVVFNGGETTLYPNISDLIDNAKIHNSQVILFTNGRNLSDKDYAQRILKNLSRVTIPLYGVDPIHHDNLTKINGSFSETIEGIRNSYNLKELLFSNLLVELKCLTVLPCLDQIPKIIEFITNEFGLPDRFVLSGVISSKKALANRRKIFPEWNVLQYSVAKSFSQLIRNGFQTISLPDLPLCLLSNDQLDYYLLNNINKEYTTQPVEFTYFDVSHPKGVKPGVEFAKPQLCSNCALAFICDADKNFIQEIDPSFVNIQRNKSRIMKLMDISGEDTC